MDQLFRFPSAVERNPAVENWMNQHLRERGAIALHWFDVKREQGDDGQRHPHYGRFLRLEPHDKTLIAAS